MVSIHNTCTDPNFNIAAERYLLKNSNEDIFMMWQNVPSVIVGKHQNIEAEVNLDFVHENDIQIARRFSGGGTVYHDLGNVNLTFIEREGKCDFRKFPRLIIDFLSTLGIHAIEDQRLGLTIDGSKISGSAQYIYKNTTLFHATLLFSSNLTALREALATKDYEIQTKKYVKSVSSPVTNICDHLLTSMAISDFKSAIMNHFAGESYAFDDMDIASIQQIKTQKP